MVVSEILDQDGEGILIYRGKSGKLLLEYSTAILLLNLLVEEIKFVSTVLLLAP